MSTRLYLIRHTAVAVASGVCYGRSDVPLAAPVDAHAAALRARLPPATFIVSSPLSRCRLLAEALGPTGFEARLMELDFGAWELRPYADLPRKMLDEWAADPWGFRPPGGETGEEMTTRVLACLDELLARHTTLAIVAHGGPLRVIAGHLLSLPRSEWLPQSMPLGGCMLLESSEQAWRMPPRKAAAPPSR